MEPAADRADAYWAHQRQDPWSSTVVAHGLHEHLLGVAALAREFASPGGANLAELAGLWHDLGKFRPGFQRYIRLNAEAHIEGRIADGDKTHSAAGALHALRELERRWPGAGSFAAKLLAYLIAGHHAGLGDWIGGLDDRLLGNRKPDSEREYDEARAACAQVAPQLLAPPVHFDPADALRALPGLGDPARPLAASMALRMLFSALVDADFLDTEAFMNAARAGQRAAFPPLTDYHDKLDHHLAGIATRVQEAGRADDAVMQARRTVLAQCRDKAAALPGVFTLTVPTGGGKTLSSLAFALAHACAHGKRCIVYAIPYTSIIEQTAEVFADIFDAANVVEHHSQADAADRQETAASRLACENWDAPLVVTTNVQLFESLFAARTSRCRKLHRLADSVIVLDEAQLLPPAFLQPILDALNVLVAHHGVTLLLCTATQPALTSRSEFDARRTLRGLPEPTPIVEDEAALFAALERVSIRWPADLVTPSAWGPIVEELHAHDCVLVVVNTRRDAHELTRLLPPDTLHLSAAMCGAHRKAVIDDIRARLAARAAGGTRALRVVSTQLVEAGVDLDFPVVYRALAGLDSIAQAAGRCNREGRLERGQVVVFVRELPRGLASLQAGVQATRSLAAEGLGSSLRPEHFRRYFRDYYRSQPLDAKDIVAELADRERRLDFNFRKAADAFKLVDDEGQASLVIPYHVIDPALVARYAAPVQMLRQGQIDRWLLRTVQRLVVNVRERDRAPLLRRGDAVPTATGLYVLADSAIGTPHNVGEYDPRFGLLPEGSLPDVATMVQ